MLAATELSPLYLLGGALLALIVAVVQLQRPAAKSVIVLTAQRAHEEAVGRLAETRAMLESIIENNMTAIGVRALDGTEILANEAWASLRRNYAVEAAEAWRHTDQRAHLGPVREDIEVEGPTGTLILDTIKFPLQLEGGDVYATCTVALDTTAARRAARDLQRSNEDLEAFAFVASHDIREPLRTMTGYAELVERRYRDALDPDAVRHLQTIRDAGRRGLELTDDLLRLARAGSRRLDDQDVDLGVLVREVLDGIDEIRVERDASIQVEALPVAHGDPAMLRPLFQNLIVNAIRYVPAGQRPVLVVMGETVDGDVHLAISDNGPGIPAGDRERIFEMFHRAVAPGAPGGSGLGLAVCQRIVERHGGRIWVEPAPGGGSVFRFTLPSPAKAQGA